MNRSGDIVPHLLRRFGGEPPQMCVAVDNMDLAPGEVRMKTRGSGSSHNGISSIESVLGHSDFPRIYIGIGRPRGDGDVIGHVLGSPEGDERARIDHAIGALADLLVETYTAPIDRIVSEVNRLRQSLRENDGRA
jgi:PTH1 family peptidyl-tRNA hydrolase